MKDYTVVYFNGIQRGFSIPATLCEFEIGGMEFSIKFYGLLIALGYILALVAATRLAKKRGIDVDALYDAVIFGTIGGIIGARAYYVLFNLDYYAADPRRILSVTEGGLAIYGGIIGSVLVALIVCKLRKLKPLDMLDLAAVGFLLGQGIGRWGNFTNQEAFGTNTNLPWGMTSTKISQYIINSQDALVEKGITMDPFTAVHPTFLYESVWCILGFILLYIMFSKFRKFKGQIALSYGVWYGLERAVVEGLRTDSLYIGETGVRVSQVLSAVLALVCLILLIVGFVKNKQKPFEKNVSSEDEATDEETDDTTSKAKGDAKGNAKAEVKGEAKGNAKDKANDKAKDKNEIKAENKEAKSQKDKSSESKAQNKAEKKAKGKTEAKAQAESKSAKKETPKARAKTNTKSKTDAKGKPDKKAENK